MSSQVIPLRCSVKDYHWGKLGHDSVVGQLAHKSGSISELDPKKPYAELWMGTHPSGPSIAVAPDGEEIQLSELLRQSPEYAGTMSVVGKYGANLPFLFKVLSINEPLSIQSHPDKELAKVLHAKDPKNYPDDNHKPEMAIALTDMELLCSFRPHEQILESLANHSELSSIIHPDNLSNYFNATDDQSRKVGLKECFKSIVEADDVAIEAAIKSLVTKFTGESIKSDLSQLFLRVSQKYPKDVGCLCLFFLNYVKLKPFEAVFLAANEPHSYISGDCVECMAQSDNVIRAGFTPKFKDKAALVSSLTYNSIPITGLILKPHAINPFTKLYNPPVDEFLVDKIELVDTEIGTRILLEQKSSGSILILISGTLKVGNTNQQLVDGSIHFIPASLAINLINGTSNVLAFRAFCY